MTHSREIEKAIFEAALGVEPPATRQAFLERVFHSDPDGLARLSGLLEVEREAIPFFLEASESRASVAGEILDEITSTGEPPAPPAPSPDEEIGTCIGCYRLVRRIGEGGCGVVYEADQEEPVCRRVALKVIRLGMDTESVIARFGIERQALALMDHPNIARVLDVGTTSAGRPYFVMELIDGEQVTSFCDQHQLDVEARLGLFIQICHAIQHAHQKGIIHRDIKPSNILVTTSDGVPAPKVIDFGIAKATSGRRPDRTLITGADQFLGTPAYMSPEQVDLGGLDVDTRSDIYSLGVLLYELLTGSLPFDAAELARSGGSAIRRKILEREPLIPSATLFALDGADLTDLAARQNAEPARLASMLRGDLDWIVMKALAKDRNRRYQAVGDLAEDLRCYLNHQPVTAHRPGRLYVLRKFVRRNRSACLSGILIAVSVLGCLGASTWLYLREGAALAEQQRLRIQAERARDEATRLRQQAQARANVSWAAILISERKIDEADALLRNTRLEEVEPSREAANVFGALGERNALAGRWSDAARCFALLIRANRYGQRGKVEKKEDLLGPGPTFLQAGDQQGYEEYRREMIARLTDRSDIPSAERLLKASLLSPTDPAMLDSLKPTADRVADWLMTDRSPVDIAWCSLALTFYEYRRGEFTAALGRAARSRSEGGFLTPDRDACLRCLAAMAEWRLGNRAAARTELAAARALFAANKVAPAGNGLGSSSSDCTWWDCATARVLLREAGEMIAPEPGG